LIRMTLCIRGRSVLVRTLVFGLVTVVSLIPKRLYTGRSCWRHHTILRPRVEPAVCDGFVAPVTDGMDTFRPKTKAAIARSPRTLTGM
jgi:hypothetical protein